MVFDVGLEHFFSEKRVHRQLPSFEQRETTVSGFAGQPDSRVFFEVLAFGSPQKLVSAYLAEFPKRGATELREHLHEGSEFIHVLDGTLG